MASKRNVRVCLDDFERDAAKILDPMFYSFYRGGSDDEVTLRDSREAFSRYRFKPRVLRDVSRRDLSTTILGQRVAFPLCISPSAFHKAAHPDGEIATAKGAEAAGIPFSMSCGANVLIEDIAKAAPNVPKMMQTYLYQDPKITELFLRRAEKAGFKALLVTVDIPVYGKRRGERRFDFYKTARTTPKYAGLKCVNMEMMKEGAEKALARGDTLYWEYNDSASCSVTWADIKWLKRISSIAIVVKGILTGDMAREAVQAGVDGIMVSAHGGRQLDSAIAPLDALPEVVEAVKGSGVEVYVDGGIRSGNDILKALALGARAAFIGRPSIYGIACGGHEGLKELLDILKDEFSRAMALTGCASVKEIDRSLVVERYKAYPSKL